MKKDLHKKLTQDHSGSISGRGESLGSLVQKLAAEDPHEPLTENEFANLKPGDVVQHLGSGTGYTIVRAENGVYYATRSIVVSNPQEWTLISPSHKTPKHHDANDNSTSTG